MTKNNTAQKLTPPQVDAANATIEANQNQQVQAKHARKISVKLDSVGPAPLTSWASSVALAAWPKVPSPQSWRVASRFWHRLPSWQRLASAPESFPFPAVQALPAATRLASSKPRGQWSHRPRGL